MSRTNSFQVLMLIIAGTVAYYFNSSENNSPIQVGTAIEQLGNTFYVDSAATGLNDGTNWANAFNDLQDALSIATTGDSIFVAKGTYYPAASPPPTYNMYTDCSMGGTNAIIKAGNDSITIEFLTNKIEYVKIWNSGYSTFMHPQLDMSYLCDTVSSMHAVAECDQGFILGVDVPAGTYRVVINYFPCCIGDMDCYVNFVNGNDVIIPAIAPADRTISFNIPDLYLLGGFDPANGDSLLENRNPLCNKTILSGDIDEDGILNDGNSYHVVTTFNSEALIDGFCITGGNANFVNPDTPEELDFLFGGGLFNRGLDGDSSKPIIRNSQIFGNNAMQGGGVANYGDFGAAIISCTNCILNGNSADLGAGIFNYGAGFQARASFVNSIISGNSAAIHGGGLFNDGDDGGNVVVSLINTTINGNYAGGLGGAMFNTAAGGIGSVVITNCILWDNFADNTAHVVYNDEVFPVISYSLVQGNDINDQSAGDPNTDAGNNIFNQDPAFVTPQVASVFPSTGGDFHLTPGSPAIDTGLNSANNELTDLEGNPRTFNGRIDLGPYEFDGTPCSAYISGTVYVDSTATGANDGTSWLNAYIELRDALEAARDCESVDTIKVAQGTYYPSCLDTITDLCLNIVCLPLDRSLSFEIRDSMVLLGGYPQGGGTNEERDHHCHITILSGDINHDGDSTGNTFNVIKTIGYLDTIVFDGFVIEHGYAIANGEEGGGWWDGSNVDSALLCIRNTIFRNNYALFGGGFYGEGTRDLKIISAEFYDNEVTNRGGAIYFTPPFAMDTAYIRIENNLMHHNTATNNGGAIGITNTDAMVLNIINSTISQNLPDAFNNNSAGGVSILNSILWNNGATQITGAVLPTVNFSIVQGGYPGTGNKMVDPLFQSPTSNFHLSQGSPAIDMGENSYSQESTDLDGLPRISRFIIDMGAYENILYCFNDTIYVNADGTIPYAVLDSVLKAPIPTGFELLVNGGDISGLIIDCEDLGSNDLFIELLRSCNQELIDSCSMNITFLDTFPKNLVCNDLVNVSLGTGCLKVVTTDDVLENIMGCRILFDVELSYPLGTHKFPPANDLLDESHIGYTMVYSVYETLTGNKCWGYLKVEDKLPPLLNCIDDTIACYELPDLPLLAPNADDCYDGKVELISDEWFDYGCDSVLSGYVIRTIQGTDRWGNFRRCTSIISIERTVLDSVECPDLVELPCEIRTQIGGGKTLKTPITVDQTKVTPAYLLSLQKRTWEFTDNTKDWILNPSVQVVPQIQGQNIYPGAAGICKISSTYKDTRLDVCGAGFKIYREWTIVDWCTQQDTTCGQYIKVTDTEAPVLLDDLSTLFYNASPHECLASVTIPALIPGTDFRDCNLVNQTYILQYEDPAHPGKIVVLTGSLPSKTLLLPTDSFYVSITLTDLCNNRTTTSRNIFVYDITPPTPVCDEFTQVTLDPVTCWARIAAKDLDNGSRDNCCGVLHFAAASMDSITYWTNYWNTKLETEVGKEAFWHDKALYDELIEDWINCYVFADSIQVTECGNSQIVLRVYEACGVPKRDPHIFPCSEHAWFCYNTYLYIGDFNFNWFDANGPHSCTYRPELTSLAKMDLRYAGYETKGYLKPKYVGAAQFIYCDVPFYFPTLANSSGGTLVPGTYCSIRQYSDCMINVLVDDKQAPIVAELEDVIVYCDRAPENAYAPNCMGGEEFNVWPGVLKDKKGVEHGYYGGSDFLGIHLDEHETAGAGDPCGYDNAHHWAPIYCRSWLYLDSFDSAGKIDPKQYFETLVLFDKTRPTRTLLAKEFSITDNCRLNDTTLKMSDEGSLNGCGEGWIQRMWTIQDKCGNTVTAKQKVVVKHRSDFEVIFPEDKVVECDFLNTTDPKDAGEPIISDDECEQVGIQYKDEVFTVEDSACYKIVRTWTLIDWCIYNPNAQFHYSDVIVDDRLRADTGNRSCVYRHLKDNNDGYMKYIQVIKVIDKVAPTVTTRDTTICIYSEDCLSALVRIPFNATDNCTATSELSYRVEVDLNATSTVFTNRPYVKSSIDQTTQSNQIEFVYSPSVAGKHVVHVIVKDNCGNEDTSSYRFELVDCKKPTPYCYNGVATVIMPSNSKITVWAKDLDAGSLDNCTLAANLKFSFSSNSSETSKEFTCADIPDGKSKTIPVDIWVTDEAGNQDHCSTYILLQDNSGNVCPDVAGLSVTIAGTIQTETNEPVEHVRVNIYGGALQMNYQTGIKGTYHFEGLPSKSNYSLKSTRDDQPMNGVSTLDLVLIQKHILGIELLDSPYKILAADVDNDKQITAIDLVELRKLILATYEDLPNNESWRFIPKSTTFSDPQNPWNAGAAGAVSEVLEMKDVTTDYKSEDFIGLKVGDVNGTAAPHSLSGVEIRGNETGLLFEVPDQVFKHGDVVRVDFRSPNFRGISGWQGTLNVSDQLSVVSGQIEPGSLNLTNQNIGMRYAKEGKITMSWNTNAKSGLDIDEQQVLFTLVFKAQENGKLSEVLRIGSQHTIAESYQGRGPSGRDPERSLGSKGELGNLGIRFVQNGNEIVAKSELYQNYPNPFDKRTVIGINLAAQGKGTLKVSDATGRTIKSVERDWTKGYHEVWFDRKEIGASGVLYYRFESEFFTASKKMILLD